MTMIRALVHCWFNRLRLSNQRDISSHLYPNSAQSAASVSEVF